ncbi:MAG TPA: PKD domain-containing protein [Candidatus Acetothermia bacterium]|nr:PKD domain-containing protein [Candidatus Acetothermia bacterium]
MTKRFYLIVLIAVLLWLPVVGAEKPKMVPPNATAYSASELATLQAAVSSLQDLLSDYDLGSNRYFSSTEWMSLDFASYTAGILSSKGYQVRLVTQDGWADGEHVWLLVEVPISTREAWIPVEASPALGKSQQMLGSIPEFVDGAGQMWFQDKYMTFAREVVLSDNVPPVASIRVVPTQGNVGQEVTFMALASYDPDGEIVRYDWDLGGVKTSTRCTIRYAFTQESTYVIVLSVTDSRGKTVTTSINYRVREGREPASSPSGGGCGCGG